MEKRKLYVALKTADLLVPLVWGVLIIALHPAEGLHVVPELYPVPAWQLTSFMVHLFIRAGWKVNPARYTWLVCLVIAALLIPFGIIPGLGLLVLFFLLLLWPGTLLLYTGITIAELVQMRKGCE